MALEVAGKLRYKEARAALIYEVFRRRGLDGPIDAALKKAGSCSAGLFRAVAYKALAESMPIDRISLALRKEIDEGPPSALVQNGSFSTSLLDRWFAIDPGAPLSFALETEEATCRTELLKWVMQKYSHSTDQDPVALHEMIQRLAADPRNREGIQTSLDGMVAKDPGRAFEILASYDFVDATRISGGWLADADPRIPYTLGIGESLKERENIYRNSSTMLRAFREREGEDVYRASLVEGALKGGTDTLRTISNWMHSEGDFAGLEDLTRRAALAEPFTTARWLAGMPPSAERDRAVAVFAETHAAVDPERAAVWAESITDPVMREAAIRRLPKNTGKP